MKAQHKQPDFIDTLQAILTAQAFAVSTQRNNILASTDPEGVHQMRIAVRRIRSVLRSLGMADSELAQKARGLTAQLGTVRDLDVLLARYQKQDVQAGYIEHLQTQWRRKRKALKELLQSNRYREFEETLQQFQRGLTPFGMNTIQAAEHFIGQELKRTKRKGRRISKDAPDRQIHKLRLQCKRLRYLVELFERHGNIRLDAFKHAARALQSLLGEFVDEQTAIAAIRDYAAHLTPSADTREALIECGRQIEAHERAAASYRSEIPGAWSEFDATCTQKFLRRDLHSS